MIWSAAIWTAFCIFEGFVQGVWIGFLLLDIGITIAFVIGVALHINRTNIEK